MSDEGVDELGPVVSKHPMTKQSLILPLAPAVIAAILLISWATDSEMKLHVLFIGLGLLALAAWFTIGALRDDERWIVHENGLAWRRGSTVKRWTWDRVHLSQHLSSQHNRRVRMWLDGRNKTLKPSYFTDLEQLASHVERRITETQLAAFLERIDARVEVKPGRTSYDLDGVVQGGKRLAWSDAEVGHFVGGGFTIHRKGAGLVKQIFTGFPIDGGIDPSPGLQHEICQTMIARAAKPAA